MLAMPSLTSLDYAILGLLARGPASGYDIRRVFQSTALGRYSASPGSIYPAIRRLKGRALVRGKHDGSGRGRTEWRLSPAGRTRLVAWIKEPIAADDLFRDSASVDLRLAFVSDVAPESLPAFLANYAEAAGAYVEMLEAGRAFV